MSGYNWIVTSEDDSLNGRFKTREAAMLYADAIRGMSIAVNVYDPYMNVLAAWIKGWRAA